MAAIETPADRPQVVVLPPLLYAVGFVLGLIVELIWRTHLAGPAIRFTAGPLLVIAGLLIMYSGLRAFQRAGTNVEVYRPATDLVVTGPYRYTRNPIYLGMTGAYVGAALLADSVWVLVLAIPIVLTLHFGVILPEERYLTRKFDTAYRDYMRSVRRWL